MRNHYTKHATSKTLVLALALAASGAAFAQAAAPTATAVPGLTKPQVTALLESQGYTKVHDVKFDNGLWEADATSANGKDVDVRVDPATQRVFTDGAVSQLSKDDVKAKVTAAGYSKVHDVGMDDGLWKAKAKNAAGKEVKLKLDPADGRVLNAELD